jgi:hypothetical protein
VQAKSDFRRIRANFRTSQTLISNQPATILYDEIPKNDIRDSLLGTNLRTAAAKAMRCKKDGVFATAIALEDRHSGSSKLESKSPTQLTSTRISGRTIIQASDLGAIPTEVLEALAR